MSDPEALPGNGALARASSPTEAAGSGRLAAWVPALTFVVLLCGAAAPVLSVKVPILADYVNHLGRMYVIAHRGDDPFLARYYEVHWHLVPNLAMDAIVPVLARGIGIFAAGKLFVLATMLLVLTGVCALHRALFARLSAWPLVAFLFIYNWVFLFGFINYLFSVGLALWAAAAWIALRQSGPLRRGLVSLAFVLLLFLSHLQGVELYGLTVLCYELWRFHRHGLAGWRRLLPDLLAFALPFMVVPPLMAFSPTTGYALETRYVLQRKMEGLYWVVKNYDPAADIFVAAAVAALVAWALATGRLRFHPMAPCFLAAALAAFAATPTVLMSADYVDTRLPVAFLFMAIGMASWEPREARPVALLCGALVALVALRLALVEATWRHFAGVIGDVERSFAEIPPGSRVLVASRLDSPLRYTWKVVMSHFPSLVMIERSAFDSHAFTHPGKQVLTVKQPYRSIASLDGDPFDVAHLTATPEHPGAVREDGYWSSWQSNYDYVYVLFAEPGERFALPAVRLAYQGGTFQLYRIDHPAGGGR